MQPDAKHRPGVLYIYTGQHLCGTFYHIYIVGRQVERDELKGMYIYMLYTAMLMRIIEK